MLGVSVATIRRWRLLGKGPRFTKLGASIRYREEDVEAFIEQNVRGGCSAK
jgi:predicted DNA-binding transcriptional regulator AlpA